MCSSVGRAPRCIARTDLRRRCRARQFADVRLDHGGDVQAGVWAGASPYSASTGVGDRRVAGKQVGVETHVSRAARVGVVAESRSELRGGLAQSSRWCDVFAANVRAEDDDHVFLRRAVCRAWQERLCVDFGCQRRRRRNRRRTGIRRTSLTRLEELCA